MSLARLRLHRIHIAFSAFFLLLIGNSEGRGIEIEIKPALRRPVAVVLASGGKRLVVANQRSSSLTLVDLEAKQVVNEVEIGQRLSDAISLRRGSLLLATDEGTHELLLLNVDGDKIEVKQKLAVNHYPVNVVVSGDDRRAFVASLWSRRVTFVQLPDGKNPAAQVTGEVDLPFAPRKQLLVADDSRLIVADSHGGRLAVVDTESMKLLSVREFPGHNIRGLGVSSDGRMLVVAHQMLNELAHTVRNDVHWGLLMSNDLRWLSLKAVLDANGDLYKGAHMHPIGEAGRGGGDPGGLVMAPDGSVIVTVSGTDEVAFGKENDFSLFRLGVTSTRPAERVGRESRSEASPYERLKGGDEPKESYDGNEYGLARKSGVMRRPTAVTVSADSRFAYVANTFADSISIISLKEHEAIAEIPLGPQPELTLAQRGELLFHDASLSHDGWMSCQSCHSDGHTNGHLNDNFSDKSFGAPKRVLSLLGRNGTAPFAWNATAEDFGAQIRKSIIHTMQGDKEPTDKQVEALTAFLETLPPPPPIDLARGQRDEAAVARGNGFFKSRRCDRCHAPPTYTTPRTYNVGLTDKLGRDHFNPPPLVGVGQRGPYLHDGQAKSLEDVFKKFKHKVPADLSEEQLSDLLAFLRSL